MLPKSYRVTRNVIPMRFLLLGATEITPSADGFRFDRDLALYRHLETSLNSLPRFAILILSKRGIYERLVKLLEPLLSLAAKGMLDLQEIIHATYGFIALNTSPNAV